MKTEKIESCWLCKYSGGHQCHHSRGPKDILPEHGIHPNCSLPDWPEVGVEEIAKHICIHYDCSDSHGNRYPKCNIKLCLKHWDKKLILTILESIGVIIKEEVPR